MISATEIEKAALEQAKEIFNNSIRQIFDKVIEESCELNVELIKRTSLDNIIEEMGDLLYSINQLACKLETNPQECLQKAIIKNEKKRTL